MSPADTAPHGGPLRQLARAAPEMRSPLDIRAHSCSHVRTHACYQMHVYRSIRVVFSFHGLGWSALHCA